MSALPEPVPPVEYPDTTQPAASEPLLAEDESSLWDTPIPQKRNRKAGASLFLLFAGIFLVTFSALRVSETRQTVANQSLADGIDLVLNGGFEDPMGDDGAEGWVSNPGEGGHTLYCGRDRLERFAGLASFRVEAKPSAAGSEAGCVQRLAGAPLSESILLEGYIRTQKVAEKAVLRLYLIDEQSGAMLAEVETKPLTATSDWRLVQVQARVPEHATAIVVAAVLQGGGQAWFDKVRVLAADAWLPEEKPAD